MPKTLQANKRLVLISAGLLTVLAMALCYWGSPLNARLPGPVALRLNLLAVTLIGILLYSVLFWKNKISREPREATLAFVTLCITPPIMGFAFNLFIIILFIAFFSH